MNEPITFIYDATTHVRVVMLNDEPWFVAKDICDVLEITNSRDALSRLDGDEKGVVSTDTPGGVQGVAAVSEAGLYKLIMSSRKPEAKPFQRWVTHEVLPSIRKHGGYLTPQKIEEVLLNPDTIIHLATQLKQEQETRRQLEAKVEANKPMVIFAEAMQVSHDTILIGELAKLLKQNGIDIGQNRLYEWLRQEGYLGKYGDYYNVPTQRAMDLNLFEIQRRIISKPDGTNLVSSTTRVTGKGQVYFINKFRPKMSVALQTEA